MHCWCICWSLHLDCCVQFPLICLQSILRHHRSNEWHFASFEFELFELDEFCSTTYLLYYDWNLFSTRKLCSSCLRSNYFTSLIISFPWRKRVNQSGHQGLLSRYLWSPRRPSLGGTGTVEVKICCGVWGLQMILCCWYLVATSYFSMFCRRFSVQSQLKFG